MTRFFHVYFFCLIFNVISAEYNMMVVDSSFPPLQYNKFKIGHGVCYLINEANKTIPLQGDCYDTKDWIDNSEDDVKNIKGLMDHLAKKETPLAQHWLETVKKYGEQTKKVQNTYILMTHGTRSSSIAYDSSFGLAEILPIRVTTTKAGSSTEQKSYNEASKIDLAYNYDNGCSLRKWSDKEKEEFKKGKIQMYQERIANILQENKTIKIITISLGYKYSWIVEDNPKCKTEQNQLEYAILQVTWKNFFNKFKDRLFFVAAGNENEDFDNALYKNNDLWGALSDLNNLILIGSLKVDEKKFPSSNYGKMIIMAKGEEISVRTPLPRLDAGYFTTVRGTSFSTPLVAGRALWLWEKDKNLKLEQLKAKLITYLKDNKDI